MAERDRALNDEGRAARLYYEHDMTHQEIGDLMGLSRIKVTRLIAKARETGMVRVTVRTDAPLFTREVDQLCKKFGLTAAWIAPTGPTFAATRTSVARVAAHALRAVIRPGSTIAIALSNTLAQTLEFIEHTDGAINVVPATGSLLGPDDGTSAMQLALQLARSFHGRAMNLPAPLVAASAQAAQSYLADPGIARTLDAAASADLCLAGIGSLDGDGGLLMAQLSEDERQQLLASGAVGDMAARFFDAAGEAVVTPLTQRIIGLELKEIAQVDKRLAVTHGRNRHRAIQVAVARGLVNMLVTDFETARELIESDFPVSG